MSRSRKKHFRRNGAAAPAAAATINSPWSEFFNKLTNKRTAENKNTTTKAHIQNKDLTFILRNLSTLIRNGVSLPKALATLTQEKDLEKYKDILGTIRHKVEIGESFSSALAAFPTVFDKILVSQIHIGERAGSVGDTLDRIAAQREQNGQLKSMILKKLAYPIVLITLGSGVLVFMLTYVIPTFEKTYSSAGIPLPAITEFLITVSSLTKAYGWLVIVAGILGTYTIVRLRRNDPFAFKMDRAMLNLPLIGDWLRDIAVLQLMEVLGNLMEAGFTLAESLGESADSIRNRAVKKNVFQLQSAVLRGEKFSREIERMGDMFPPVVSQLVIVGEQTGKLASATSHIRSHLQREIERKTNLMIGTIEPVLTIGMASAIAVILLAIYLPMFDMINTADM